MPVGLINWFAAANRTYLKQARSDSHSDVIAQSEQAGNTANAACQSSRSRYYGCCFTTRQLTFPPLILHK